MGVETLTEFDGLSDIDPIIRYRLVILESVSAKGQEVVFMVDNPSPMCVLDLPFHVTDLLVRKDLKFKFFELMIVPFDLNVNVKTTDAVQAGAVADVADGYT